MDQSHTDPLIIAHSRELQSLKDQGAAHDAMLKTHAATLAELSTGIAKLNSHLAAIKWLAIGAGLAIICHELGIDDAVKILVTTLAR